MRVALTVMVACAVSMVFTGCEKIGFIGTDACLGCHNGRYAPDRSEFPDSKHAEVGCEACHGGGYLHAAAGGTFGLFIDVPDASRATQHEFCGKCHENTVTEYLKSAHFASKEVACLDCHEVHDENPLRLSIVDNALCLSCHKPYGFENDAAVSKHTFHDVDPAGTGASRCVNCHQPPLVRVNQAEGPHGHSMIPIQPKVSNEAIAAGITPTPPNSCAGIVGCHDGSNQYVPVFDVDSVEDNTIVQAIYDSRYGV